MPRSSASHLEILESRIAPAVFYVSPNAPLAVHKDGKTTVEAGDAASATAVGASFALPMKAGDSLVFDTNDDGVNNAGDVLLLKVTAGKALAFLTDAGDGTGNWTAADGKYESNELTGLALGPGFKGSGSSVSGPVVTALDSMGHFTIGANLTMTNSSIAGLTLTGKIAGDLLAGGSISGVIITGATTPAFETQVSLDGMIVTGSKTASRTVSFNHGATTFTTDVASGVAGGDISQVTLAHGLIGLKAGVGASAVNGGGGKGGSITGVTVTESVTGYTVEAGNGGAVTGAGQAGAGGSVFGSFAMAPGSLYDLVFSAGRGGSSANGSAGAGGSITKTTLTVSDPAHGLTLAAGAGGDASQKGNGGAGGAITGLHLTTGDLASLSVSSGLGGKSATTAGNAGAGGALSGTVSVGGLSSSSIFQSGGGGAGYAKGGAGGALAVDFDASNSTALVAFKTGLGGDARSSAGSAASGAGGAISGSVKLHGTSSGVTFLAGAGGTVPDGKAGAGGSISKLSITDLVPSAGSISVKAGAGGALSSSTSGAHTAGAGGAITNFSLANKGGITGFDLASGQGGNVSAGAGKAGAGGAVTGVVVANDAQATGAFTIHSGEGGAALSVGTGGASGNVSKVTIDDSFGAMANFEVYAGVSTASINGPKFSFNTMAGGGSAGRGGDVGSISTVNLNKAAGASDNSHFIVGRAGPAGPSGSGVDAHAGNGGSISGITGLVGTLDIVGSDGGASSDGFGGAGASISNVKVTTSGPGHYVHLIAAGNGGASGVLANQDGNLGGAGGSVSKITVDGDIGNVTSKFGMNTTNTSMGGISAGMGGAVFQAGVAGVNGSVKDIDVGTHTIAAIIAGRTSNVLTYANAVTKISGLKAGAIGADTGLSGTGSQPGTKPGTTFDFNEGGSNNTFEPDDAHDPTDGDVAIDGLVLVKKGGYMGPAGVTPLLLIEV